MDLSNFSLAALVEEVKDKQADGCDVCSHLGKRNRAGVRYCDVHGVYNPVYKCAFFDGKDRKDENIS